MVVMVVAGWLSRRVLKGRLQPHDDNCPFPAEEPLRVTYRQLNSFFFNIPHHQTPI